MKRTLIIWILLMITGIIFAQGRIVIGHDVNTLATQFEGMDQRKFAVNVAKYLIGDTIGNVLAIESNPSDHFRNYSIGVKDTLASSGYIVTYSDTAAGFSLDQLLPFDAIFSGITYPSWNISAINHTVLFDYANNGGNVYVFAGVASAGDFDNEIQLLNPFLQSFGLEYVVNQNTITGDSISSSHQIFDGIKHLPSGNGNSILSLGTNPNSRIIEFHDDQGLYAIVEPVTHIDERISLNGPNHYILNTNYPNPFNPSTTISYSIPKKEFVTLRIFDVMGRKIQILVNNFQHPGTHYIKFEASNLSSGIYFYQLRVGHFIKTKKMVLIP